MWRLPAPNAGFAEVRLVGQAGRHVRDDDDRSRPVVVACCRGMLSWRDSVAPPLAMRRLPQLFLVALVASLVACTVSTEPPPHVRPRNEAHGEGDPTPAIAAEPAAEERLQTTVSGTAVVTANGAKLGEIALPPITATWRSRVRRSGDARVADLVIDDASFDPGDADTRTVKATERAVEILKGVRATAPLDERGALGPVDMQIAPREIDDLRPGVEAVLMVLPLFFAPAPGDALEPGARYSHAADLSFAEMRLRQSAEAKLTARDAGRVTLSVTLTDTMPSPSAVRPGSRQIQALDASIEGTVTLESGRLLPVAIDATVHAVQTSEASSGDSPMTAALALDLHVQGRTTP